MTDTTTTTTPVQTDEKVPTDENLPRPRIRIGAALWGLVLLAAGGGALWIFTDPARREAASLAVLGLDGFGWSIVALVTVGGILTLVALAAVIRSLQRGRA